jgi:hypothetical protein
MAKYSTVQTLKKASPTIRVADGVVKSWEIEVIYSHTDSDGKVWSRSYPHREDVEYMSKVPTNFTKAELIAFMPPNMDVIFDAHYEAHNLPPVDERVADFKLDDLA